MKEAAGVVVVVAVVLLAGAWGGNGSRAREFGLGK